MSDAAVWIDPGRRSGEPCVGGHRTPVELVIESVWHHGVPSAMDTYALSRAEVLGACWYAGVGYVVRLHDRHGNYMPRRDGWSRRWGTWAAEAHQALWEGRTDDVTDPPCAGAIEADE